MSKARHLIIFYLLPFVAMILAMLALIIYDYGISHGMKQLQYRITSRQVDEENHSQTINVAILSRQDGFLTVIHVRNNKVLLLRPSNHERPVYAGVEYHVDGIVKSRDTRVMILVTQTILPEKIADSIDHDLQLLSEEVIEKEHMLDVVIYGVLRKQGHQWVSLAEVQ
jgi:hypothetical protein